jgi:hypothetical protein
VPEQTIRNLLAPLQAPTPATETAVSLFLNNYFDESSSFDFPTEKADLVSLYRLYDRVEYLIDGYLSRMKDISLDESILTPTSSEHTRLRRAFLRFGLYSRVFPAVFTIPWETPSPDHRFSAREQFDLFLSRLKPWEVEEMTCAEQYFSTLIGGFIDDLEEQIADAVLSTPGLLLPQRSAEAAKTEETRKDQTTEQDNLRFFENLDLTSMLLFSYDNRYHIHLNIRYLASLGLNFVHDLIRSEQDKRSRLIRSNCSAFREFLAEALKHSPTWPSGHQHEKDPNIEDDPSRSNYGYYLFVKALDNGTMYLGIDSWSDSYTALRDLGYVFWDSTRLEDHLMAKKIQAADAMTWGEIREKFDRRDKITLEERFKGARLPRSEMESLEKRFGSISRMDEEYGEDLGSVPPASSSIDGPPESR